MKMLYKIFLLSLMFASIIGCKKATVETYSGLDNIYFALPFETTPAVDTSNVSLAFINDNDTLVWKVAIRFSGPVSNMDRPYVLSVSEQSTAISGTHYAPISDTHIIKAGKIADTLKIKWIKKDEALKTSRRSLLLELKANDYFKTGMADAITDAATGKKLNYLKQSIFITSQLSAPTLSSNWTTYLGTFSEKKMRLAAQVNEIANDQLYRFFLPTRTGAFSATELIQFAVKLRNYLVLEKANGRTVYEIDGVTEMKVASSYY